MRGGACYNHRWIATRYLTLCHLRNPRMILCKSKQQCVYFSRPTSSTLETRKVVVMRKLNLACVALVCFIGALFTAIAQTPRTAEQQNSDRVVISKDEVLFDLVVRDRKGKAIKDLGQQ